MVHYYKIANISYFFWDDIFLTGHWPSVWLGYLKLYAFLVIMLKIRFPREISEDLAEEVGLHLGDGSMNYYSGKGFYQLRGHIEDDRSHYISRIKPLYKKLFGIDINLRKMPSTRVYGFQIWSSELVDYKHEILGLPLGKKLDFEIPFIFRNDANLLRAFFRGFFDTDGCLYLEKKNGKLYPRIEIRSISKSFIFQSVKLLKKLGFRVTMRYEKSKRANRLDTYQLTIRGVEMTKKWFDEIAPQNSKHIEKYKKINEPAVI